MRSRALGDAAVELKRYHARLVEILKALYEPETVTLGMPAEARMLMTRARRLYANGGKRKERSQGRPQRRSASPHVVIDIADPDPKVGTEITLPRKSTARDPAADAFQDEIDANIN